MPSAAFSTSASSKTITGALPPSSRWTRLRSAAAEPATSMPARTEPVIETICGVLCSTSAAAGVAVAADDVEDARAAGTPGTARRAACELAGVVSLGLRTIGVAGRRAPGRSSRSSSSAGSSTGVTWPTTPTGSRRTHEVWSAMYSPADRPSSTRAAPAKKRKWSERVGHLLRHRQPERLAGVVALDGVDLLDARLDGVGDLEQRVARGPAGVVSPQASNAASAAA